MKFRGGILVEVVLTITINVMLILGGLEWSRYLYIRQGLAGAAGQAAQNVIGQADTKTVRLYLIGMDFPDSLIDSVTVSSSKETVGGPPGTQADKVTVSLPFSDALLFGGTFSRLVLSDNTTVSATAYFPE